MIKNPAVIGFLIIYLLSIYVLNSEDIYSLSDSFSFLLIVGVFFSTLVYLLTLPSKPFEVPNITSKAEITIVLLCLLLVTGYLSWGKSFINVFLTGDQGDGILTYHVPDLILKLILFVLIPFLAFYKFFNYSLKDFGIQFKNIHKNWWSHLPVLIGMSLVLIIFNYYAGRAADPIHQGKYTTFQLAIGLPITFLWLLFEVGLVEEFFFRALIQSRLAAYLKSELTALITTCILFGLAHVPGLYIRGAGAITVLGDSPSLAITIAYSIVVLSISGFFLGLIWIRTKNLVVLTFIHASTDLLPSFPDMLDSFGGL